ncbi:sensor histidine kinase [Liquorilactobacillus uvarum]|uniref:histidine kinase n=1 Tax=Liquorilactobacillus uvarum DSM 19971 TaxID=1423812 RepID=A0A0R1PZI3_9LACO|nr:sensor histidine kinase [Liquorilactobacillus uvarum]KRL37894.1 ATPase histidine kinase DNA gyrase B HSP90 domain protein [Liquorilactobacillus uvarum DSM 19971]
MFNSSVKHIIKIILAKWPLFILYLSSTTFLGFLCLLYNIKLILIADLIRFTLIPFLLFLFYRIYHEEKFLRNLRKASSQGQILEAVPHGLVEKAFISSFNQLQQQRIQYEKEVQKEFKQHRDYLVMWSHEVKTPLTALSLMAENENEVASIDVQQQIALAYHQLNLILTYERLADFNHDLVFKWISVSDIIEVLIKRYAVFFIRKEITPHIKITAVKALTDPKWLSFILEQLLMNALKYSKKGASIEIEWQDNAIKIVDNGIGIDASDLPRVFEPGFTGQNGRHHNSATGMGLYIAQRISKLLDLKLTIESEISNGTSAIILIPETKIKY